jgi:hypothetical protein
MDFDLQQQEFYARISQGYWGSQRFSFSTPAGDKPQMGMLF